MTTAAADTREIVADPPARGPSLDLVGLTYTLRQVGIKVSPDQLLGAQQLLLVLAAQGKLAGCSELELGPHLRAVLCSTPEEVQRFDQEYRRWLGLSPLSPDNLERDARLAGWTAFWHKHSGAIVHWGLIAVVCCTLLTVRRSLTPYPPPEEQHKSDASTGNEGSVPPPLPANRNPGGTKVLGSGVGQKSSELPPEYREVWYGRGSDPTVGRLLSMRRIHVHPPLTFRRQVPWTSLGGLLLVGSVITIGSRWFSRRRLQVVRGLAPSGSRVLEVPLPARIGAAADGMGVRETSRGLRSRIRVDSGELDVDRTLDATLRAGGFPTPVFGSQREPGYLVLTDERRVQDHQARLADELLAGLEQGNVLLERFWFDTSPESCYRRESGPAERVSLDALLARYPEHRLILLGNGQEFFDSFTGNPADWTELLEGRGQKVLLTPRPMEQWTNREWLLERKLGLRVLPLSKEGLQLLDGAFAETAQPIVDDAWRGRRTTLPQTGVHRWVDRSPPDEEVIRELVLQLETDLEPAGFRWLAATAVYPEVHWGITLRLGLRLVPDRAQFDRLLPRLSQTVWLRQGYFPDWLREALTDRLSPAESAAVDQTLAEIGAEVSQASGQSGASRPARGPLEQIADALKFLDPAARAARRDDRLDDFVMLKFLSRRQNRLWMQLPEVFRQLLFPRGLPLLGLRFSTAGIACLCVLAVLWVWRWPVTVRPETLRISSRLDQFVVQAQPGEWRSLRSHVATEGQRPLSPIRPRAALAVACSRDGKQLACGEQDRITLWEAETGKSLGELSGVGLQLSGPPNSGGAGQAATGGVSGQLGVVTQIVFAPRGLQLASLTVEGKIQVWDLTTRRPLRELGQQDLEVAELAYSPDGRVLASAGRDGTVRRWNVDTGEEIGTPLAGAEGVYSVAFSPDGKRLVVGGAKGTLTLYDLAAGDRVWNLAGHAGPVRASVFSLDGTMIASGGVDARVRLWDATTGESRHVLEGPIVDVKCLAFDPRGAELVGAGDGAICVWDVATGQLRQIVDPAGKITLAVAYSTDGSALAHSSEDRSGWISTNWDREWTSKADQPESARSILARDWSENGSGTEILWGAAPMTKADRGGPVLAISEADATVGIVPSPSGDAVLAVGEDTFAVWPVPPSEPQTSAVPLGTPKDNSTPPPALPHMPLRTGSRLVLPGWLSSGEYLFLRGQTLERGSTDPNARRRRAIRLSIVPVGGAVADSGTALWIWDQQGKHQQIDLDANAVSDWREGSNKPFVPTDAVCSADGRVLLEWNDTLALLRRSDGTEPLEITSTGGPPWQGGFDSQGRRAFLHSAQSGNLQFFNVTRDSQINATPAGMPERDPFLGNPVSNVAQVAHHPGRDEVVVLYDRRNEAHPGATQVFDIRTAVPLTGPESHESPVVSLTLPRQGRNREGLDLLVTGHADGTLTEWLFQPRGEIKLLVVDGDDPPPENETKAPATPDQKGAPGDPVPGPGPNQPAGGIRALVERMKRAVWFRYGGAGVRMASAELRENPTASAIVREASATPEDLLIVCWLQPRDGRRGIFPVEAWSRELAAANVRQVVVFNDIGAARLTEGGLADQDALAPPPGDSPTATSGTEPALKGRWIVSSKGVSRNGSPLPLAITEAFLEALETQLVPPTDGDTLLAQLNHQLANRSLESVVAGKVELLPWPAAGHGKASLLLPKVDDAGQLKIFPPDMNEIPQFFPDSEIVPNSAFVIGPSPQTTPRRIHTLLYCNSNDGNSIGIGRGAQANRRFINALLDLECAGRRVNVADRADATFNRQQILEDIAGMTVGPDDAVFCYLATHGGFLRQGDKLDHGLSTFGSSEITLLRQELLTALRNTSPRLLILISDASGQIVDALPDGRQERRQLQQQPQQQLPQPKQQQQQQQPQINPEVPRVPVPEEKPKAQRPVRSPPVVEWNGQGAPPPIRWLLPGLQLGWQPRGTGVPTSSGPPGSMPASHVLFTLLFTAEGEFNVNSAEPGDTAFFVPSDTPGGGGIFTRALCQEALYGDERDWDSSFWYYFVNDLRRRAAAEGQVRGVANQSAPCQFDESGQPIRPVAAN